MKVTSRWSLALLPALVIAWLLLPLVASAHALLVRSDPQAGALVTSSPPYIQIEWSESVSLDFGSIKVYDSQRNEQRIGAIGQPAGQDTVLKASLAKPLPPGTYTVVWRVVSSTDGHVTAGNFAFRVKGAGGAGSVDDSTPITPDSTLAADNTADDAGPLRWLVRAAILAGTTLLVGGALFTIGVVGPSAAERGEAGAALKPVVRAGFARLGVMVAGVVVLALLLDLVGQVAAIRNTSFLGALGDSNAAWELISTTPYGFAWVLKLGAGIALFGVMLFVWLRPGVIPLRIGPTPWDLVAATGALLLLGEAISSHAAAIHSDVSHSLTEAGGHTEPHGLGLPVPVLADWLHLTSVSMWVGGLGYMAIVLFPGFRLAGFSAEERRGFLGRAVPRFSRLAIASVVLIAITGTYNLVLHSADLGAILATAYGQILAVKVAAFVVLVGVGAINLLRLSPRLRKGEGQRTKGVGVVPHSPFVLRVSSPAQGLQRNIHLEIGLSALALVCAGGLTLLPPPTNSVSAPTTSPTAITTPAPLIANVSTNMNGYNILLAVKPGADGDQFTLDVTREVEASPPLTDVLKVLFRVRPLDVGSGNTAYTAEAVGPPSVDRGRWIITEPVLTITGGYIVACIVERTQSPDLQAAFQLDWTGDSLKAIPTAVETPGP